MTGMKDVSADPKQQAILEAAWAAFATYGYRKTSMDDIARGAGVSRPALYLHYRNKEDIFRSLARHIYDLAARDLEAELAREGPLPERLAAAFEAQSGEFMEAMLSSPHGLELLDTGFQTAADIAETGEARCVALYAAWLEREAEAGRAHLSGPAGDVAATMMAALKGIKHGAADFATYKTRMGQLARLFGTALEAGTGQGGNR